MIRLLRRTRSDELEMCGDCAIGFCDRVTCTPATCTPPCTCPCGSPEHGRPLADADYRPFTCRIRGAPVAAAGTVTGRNGPRHARLRDCLYVTFARRQQP
jgi:hypothetical protein